MVAAKYSIWFIVSSFCHCPTLLLVANKEKTTTMLTTCASEMVLCDREQCRQN